MELSARISARMRGHLLNMASWVSLSIAMKVVSSLKTLKNRHKDSRVVRRRGKVYVINKTNPRFKAKQA